MLTRFINIERLTHSFKTAIACGIALLVTRLLGLNHTPWIVITTIVVMCAQLYVGSVMQKAYLRFLGTLVGCLFAITTLETVGDSNLAIGITIGLSSLIFSYFATGQENVSYTGTLGAVTTAIIMLGQKPTIMIATLRFLEISIGILIATLISQFVLPIHARTHLRRTQATTLAQLRDYYIACMMTPGLGADAAQSQDLDEHIVKSLSKQRQLAKEAVREPLGSFYDPEQFIQFLHCEKEILRAIDFMYHTAIHIEMVEAREAAEIKTFNDAIVAALNSLIKTIAADKPDPQEHIHLPPLQPLKNKLHTMFAQASQDELIYINGFLYSVETLTQWLDTLSKLYQVPVCKEPATA